MIRGSVTDFLLALVVAILAAPYIFQNVGKNGIALRIVAGLIFACACIAILTHNV